MSVADLLHEGKLDECLAELQGQVRKDPANAKQRIFLFQLLTVLGQWDRALTQLNVSGDLDAGSLAMVQTYREALRCELLRAGVFEGKRSPLVFGDPEHWVALIIEALRLGASGDVAHSQQVRDEAFEEAPTTSGSIDGQAFEWIADADPRLGPLTEAVINGRYYWVPFSRIKRLQIEAPADLRDLVWIPANFTWANGGETVGLIPSRYPGSESSADAQVRLARKTDWVDQGEELVLPLGQRMFATDAGEFSLLETRLIELDVEAPQAPAGADPDQP